MPVKPIGHVSIDLETLGLRADAVILAIGAAFINPNTLEVHKFVTPVSIDSQPDRYRDPNTVAWWNRQSDEAKAAVLDPAMADDGPSLKSALTKLTGWIVHEAKANNLEIQVWGNGAAFDLGMLNHAYSTCGFATPWFFRSERDQRTLEFITGGIFEHDISHNNSDREGIHHEACADAVYQAKRIYKMLCQLQEVTV